jgi:hypothetical protein
LPTTEHFAEVKTPGEFARHPSSAFGTFSPRKARGEKALDVKESLEKEKCEKCD